VFSKSHMSGWMFGIQFLAALLALEGALCIQGAAEDSDRRYAEAAALIQSGETRAAVALLEDLARDRPGDADVQLLLGTASALVPRRERAVEALLRALELRPTDGRTHAAAGSALVRLGESGAALQVFERAVALEPGLAEAHLSLALILAGQEQLDRAARHMQQALALESDVGKLARLHYLSGQLAAERNQVAEAARAFALSLELDPSKGETHLALGLVLKRLLRED